MCVESSAYWPQKARIISATYAVINAHIRRILEAFRVAAAFARPQILGVPLFCSQRTSVVQFGLTTQGVPLTESDIVQLKLRILSIFLDLRTITRSVGGINPSRIVVTSKYASSSDNG